MSSFFYLQATQTNRNADVIAQLKEWSTYSGQQAYVIDKPLGDNKYAYSYNNACVLLIPKHRITFIDFGSGGDAFDSYVDDFIEDLGSISDKYRYKEVIGRPRSWRDSLIFTVDLTASSFKMDALLAETAIDRPDEQRRCELLISLLTGSINDIEKVKGSIPNSLLDRVKQKILLFDGDQTRFVYQQPTKSPVRIQGLSGTGKTELLLHKLKELYLSSPDSRIGFTCHNKILADSLQRRIPDFFNFMKVEQQIKWNERLWCVHAWGSGTDKNSGTYRYICDYYGIPFSRYSKYTTFEKVCTDALSLIKQRADLPRPFDYILIDESQDFPEVFFELCQQVTNKTVYIAGDIFQSIFDEKITKDIEPDFLLSKCYRTDPRTLMFSHGVGMGLFEQKKLRWLEDEEWQACGYILEKLHNGSLYHLKREPLRRFEDLDQANIPSVQVLPTIGNFYAAAPQQILEAIQAIREENSTVMPEDIGIILLDVCNEAFALADVLEQLLPRYTSWTVNKAHESKSRIKDALFVSNRNNVKGLEFPFVICVSERIHSSYGYRNALYMTLTRSFLRTYLVVSSELNAPLLPRILDGLQTINAKGYIEVIIPSEDEKQGIKTTI